MHMTRHKHMHMTEISAVRFYQLSVNTDINIHMYTQLLTCNTAVSISIILQQNIKGYLKKTCHLGKTLLQSLFFGQYLGKFHYNFTIFYKYSVFSSSNYVTLSETCCFSFSANIILSSLSLQVAANSSSRSDFSLACRLSMSSFSTACRFRISSLCASNSIRWFSCHTEVKVLNTSY